MARNTSERTKRLYVRKPTFSSSGTRVVTVGKSQFKVAPDWGVAFTAENRLAWILLPGDDLRLLSEKGEIVGTPDAILAEMKARLFPKTQ
jgi:hypothetical protein